MATKTKLYGRKHQRGVNWITVVAMTAFHVGAVAALFYIDLGAMLDRLRPVCHRRQPRHRHGLPPAADAPQLQDPQVGRVLPHPVRHAGARGRSHLLGGHPPHPPPAVRPRRRSAHAARRRLLGAHGLDHHGRGPAPRRVGAGALHAGPVARHVPRGAVQLALGDQRRRRPGAAGVRRLDLRAVGHLLPHHASACTARGW